MSTEKRSIAEKTAQLAAVQKALPRWTQANFDKLSAHDKNLFEKAFCTNTGDPHYRELETLSYKDGDAERSIRRVEKGTPALTAHA